jgi:hypothetical protein
MDKLEQYLEQVCRGIGGPRSLRQHIRDELRAHLNDAIDEHVSHGMTRDEAITRALEGFGGADQLRSELEATHGHRLMTVMIDKALDWKERTMKARWLWSTWAHVALVAVILIELFCLTATTVLVLPKYDQIMRDFWSTPDAGPEWNTFTARTSAILNLIRGLGDIAFWIAIGLLIVWILFEWRVRSENKPFIRLSALGSIAACLAVLSVLMFASMILPTVMAVPMMRQELPERRVSYNTQRLSTAIASLDTATAQQNWEAMPGPIMNARDAINGLSHQGAAAPSIIASSQRDKVESLRNNLRAASEAIHDAELAFVDRDASRLSAAMQRFHKAYDPVQATILPTTAP